MGFYKVECSNYKAIHGKICRTHPFFPELLGVCGWEGKWYHLQSCTHHFKHTLGETWNQKTSRCEIEVKKKTILFLFLFRSWRQVHVHIK